MKIQTCIVLSLLAVPPLAAQTTIETIGFWDGSSSIQPFGKPNTATYGQTFTVPGTDNLLQSFSFYLRDIGAGDQLVFQGYISKWDGSNLTGPLLYTSGNRNGPGVGAGFVRYDFLTGGISLATGESYIAFLSASGHLASIPVSDALTEMGYRVADVYNGGGFWYSNNGDDFSALYNPVWESRDPLDTAFELQFGEGEVPSTVPEPSTVLLVGTGVGVLLLGVRRRRKF